MDNLMAPRHFGLQWHITEKCNWRCRHCYQEPDKISSDLTSERLFMIFEQFISLIVKWQLSNQNAILAITGGEPFIRKDFFKLVDKIARHSHLFHWVIMSNGSLLTQKDIFKLKKANLEAFQVSLEGMEKNNDEIRGTGSFQTTLQAVKLLVGAGIKTLVSLTLTKKNIGDVASLAELCEKLGVYSLGVRRLVPRGQGAALQKQMLQPDELRDFYIKIKKINENFIKSNKNFRIVLGCESAIFNKQIIADDSSGMRPYLCGVTEGTSLTAMPDGDILACRRLPIFLGNALKESLHNIYYSSKAMELRNLDQLDHICKECPDFVSCFGGAKCVNYAYSGKQNIADVQCWKAYKKLGQLK